MIAPCSNYPSALTPVDASQLCAIIGGVFTVAGIVATAVDKGLTQLKKKHELGKLG